MIKEMDLGGGLIRISENKNVLGYVTRRTPDSWEAKPAKMARGQKRFKTKHDAIDYLKEMNDYLKEMKQ